MKLINRVTFDEVKNSKSDTVYYSTRTFWWTDDPNDGAHAKLIYDTWKPLLDQYRKMKDDYNKAKEMLDECRGQLEYLHNKFSKTGTTESVLSRLSTLQDSLNKDQLR